MALVGRALLVLALLVCIYGIAASVYGARSHQRRWVDSGRRAVYALAAVAALPYSTLDSAFLRNDQSSNVSHQAPSAPTSMAYISSAVSRPQHWSVLCRTLLLSLGPSLVLRRTRRPARVLAGPAAGQEQDQ